MMKLAAQHETLHRNFMFSKHCSKHKQSASVKVMIVNKNLKSGDRMKRAL